MVDHSMARPASVFEREDDEEAMAERERRKEMLSVLWARHEIKGGNVQAVQWQ